MKRELNEPHKGDKRFQRGTKEGQFSESDDMDRSMKADRRQHAKHKSSAGQGDRGDR